MSNTSKLVLIRHGQSTYNEKNLFTGWQDVELTQQGINEAHECTKLMEDISFTHAFTSKLKRAQRTGNLIMKELGKDIDTFENEALNERDYGDLSGLNKDDARKKWGDEQVHIWRRSYDVSPPGGESLKNVVDRVGPYFEKYIQPHLFSDKNVIIVAHGNSLRAIMIKIGLYKPEEISKIELPTGSPFVVNFSSGNLKDGNYLN